MGVLKNVEPTGFLAFAPAFAGTNWADVNLADHPKLPARPRRSFVFTRLFGSGFAGLGYTWPLDNPKRLCIVGCSHVSLVE